MKGSPLNRVGERLERELASRPNLRSPDVVMAPETLGAARLTRYSFSRMVLRAAVRDGWEPRRTHFDLDESGQGEAIYEWRIGDQRFSFVAFTQVLDEEMHTDRVVADRWEISAALVEGIPDNAFLGRLRHNVPLQEDGRLDPRVLVLTRGNRSVRFFDLLVDSLAAGDQPDPDIVGDAGYIMRSTAFYGNGKFGMRSFAGFPDGHPFAAPYRAQFAAAFLFRELSYDSVEHCARMRGGDRAVGFDDGWRRYFGLGNATGLGLVPYAFKHHRVMHAWAAVREIALADMRACTPSSDQLDRLPAWIARARQHFSSGTADDCAPFLSPSQLVSVVDAIDDAFALVRTDGEPMVFDRLYRWAEGQNPETAELVVSLLVELHDADDAVIDELLTVDEGTISDPVTTVAQVRAAIAQRFDWIEELALDSADARRYWWVISDNTEEPRRARRDAMSPQGRDVAIDIAHRVRRLEQLLSTIEPSASVADVVRDHPEHRLGIDRVLASDGRYGEIRDNACGADFLPLQSQRFQLAFYGMDNFKPKSTDWLRVTLFQGAPRSADLHEPESFDDTWVLPTRPVQEDSR